MSSESQNPKNPKKPMDNMPKGGVWTALIVALALVLLISWIYSSISGSQYTETSVSDFLDAMDSNQLAEVEIRYDRIVYLTKQEAAKPGSQQKACYTGLPSGGDTLLLAQQLTDMGVKVTRPITEDNSMIMMILSYAITFAILFVFMRMITKRMGSEGMIKIIPILLGVVASYVFAMIVDEGSRAHFVQLVGEADWIGLPIVWNRTALSIFGKDLDSGLLVTAIITIMPISLATMMEHVGDISAISSTVGKNYVADPGLHRTLLGDGLATIMASLFGAPANTTYGENTGVLALSKVYDPKVIRLAAYFAVILSFCPKFSAIIQAMPAATMGGVSLVLYGMISAVGVRNVVENQVDFTKSRNVLIAAMIMGLAIGVSTSTAGAISFTIGSVTISLSGLAVAALVGIIMNAILPGKDYEFGTNELGDTAVVNFGSHAK